MIQIRRLRPEEWALARRIRLAALADAPEAFAKPLARAEAITDDEWRGLARDGSASGPNCWIIALDDAGEPVGMAVGLPDADEPTLAYLVSMWVAPAHRGGDLAGRLLDAVEVWAAAGGAREILAGVTGCNARAAAFYRKRGYREITGRPAHRATAGCEVVLSRSLDDFPREADVPS